MSGYRVEWECCGDETYTQAWMPEECPFCESHRLQRELTAARDEAEKLRGRVAELRELVTLFGKLPFNCHDYMTEKQWEKICCIHAEIDDDTSGAWLFRKQAEAMERAKAKVDANAFNRVEALNMLGSYISELHKAADELEAGGGDDKP